MAWLHRKSNIAFALCCLVLIAIKLLFDQYPGEYPVKSQAAAFTWPVVAGIMALGYLGMLAERALRLPDAFADMSLERRGAIVAIVAGLAYGVLTIFMDLGQTDRAQGSVAEWPHVMWPWSVPFYTFGAILLEFLLRLGALCILTWFIHVVLLRRRGFIPTFWLINCIVALYEILPATIDETVRGDWLSVAITPLEPLYWTNVFEGWLLLKFGWFAPIAFRLAFYLLWHFIYGGLGPLSTQ